MLVADSYFSQAGFWKLCGISDIFSDGWFAYLSNQTELICFPSLVEVKTEIALLFAGGYGSPKPTLLHAYVPHESLKGLIVDRHVSD